MNTSRKATNVAPASSAETVADTRIQKLIDRGVDFGLAIDGDGVIFDAYVSSGRAARILAPLGRRAVGTFKAMPGNMVGITAIVSVQTAMKMVAAAQLSV